MPCFCSVSRLSPGRSHYPCSAKSELLRTLVLALLATHSPDELNLVLVDFKGGATFLGLERSRHVAAVITNLEQELSLVDRMGDALRGELNRRQELLRAAGNFANVTEYEQARADGADLPPLPALFVVVDEFSELLAQKPDFAELFVMIGRLGRSLHIHLLLASQRLEEGKLRGLDSHLSYRIGLKTFSANESRSVLGVPDAYHLPSVPGSAYLKCDSSSPRRFNTCYVSGPVVDEVDDDEGIPGSVGGALRMNAGAMGGWMFDRVETLRYMDRVGEAHEITGAEAGAKYRGCPLLVKQIAISAVLKGTPAAREVTSAP